jgi:alkylated DNA repair dioxygenase AlkB
MEENNRKILLETEKSKLWIIENFTPNHYENLKNIELENEPIIHIMGKECHQRRDVGFFSDKSEGYRYSNQLMKSKPLNTSEEANDVEIIIMNCVLRQINETLGSNYNGILVNRYKNGENYIGAHSDDESGLDKKKKAVASICYGAVRNFRIREKESKKIVLNYDHTPCTLLVMEGDFQKEFTHEIPKQKKITEERISLTFRHHTK